MNGLVWGLPSPSAGCRNIRELFSLRWHDCTMYIVGCPCNVKIACFLKCHGCQVEPTFHNRLIMVLLEWCNNGFPCMEIFTKIVSVLLLSDILVKVSGWVKKMHTACSYLCVCRSIFCLSFFYLSILSVSDPLVLFLDKDYIKARNIYQWYTQNLGAHTPTPHSFRRMKHSSGDHVMGKSPGSQMLPLFVALCTNHYNDVIMGVITSQITSVTIVYSPVYSDADQRNHQSSASLAFVRGIHQWPVNSPHKGASTAENVSIWWRCLVCISGGVLYFLDLLGFRSELDAFLSQCHQKQCLLSLIARFVGPTWGPFGADRTQVGPMLAPRTLVSGMPTNIWVSDRSNNLVQEKEHQNHRRLVPIVCLKPVQSQLWKLLMNRHWFSEPRKVYFYETIFPYW